MEQEKEDSRKLRGLLQNISCVPDVTGETEEKKEMVSRQKNNRYPHHTQLASQLALNIRPPIRSRLPNEPESKEIKPKTKEI
jgi:hypothetical protein